MSDREALIARLLADNEEFGKLRQDHQGYEKELDELKGRPFLSADQQWRGSEVKKLKLMAKDRMEALLRPTTSPTPPRPRPDPAAGRRAPSGYPATAGGLPAQGALPPHPQGRSPHGGRHRQGEI